MKNTLLNWAITLLVYSLPLHITAQNNRCEHGTLERHFAKSASGVNLARTLYFYDEQENLVRSESFLWDQSISLWRGSTKYQYTYDEQRRRTLVETHYWDTSSNQWKEHSKNEQYFNPIGLLSTKILYLWETSNNKNGKEWVPNEKTLYTYNNASEETCNEIFAWNSETHNWEQTYKYLFDYDNDQNLTTHWLYSWDQTQEITNQNWIQTHQYRYAYDSTKKIILTERYIWDNTENKWEKMWGKKYSSTNNQDFKETEQTFAYWDKTLKNGSGEWKNVSKTTTLIDSIYKQISEIYYQLDRNKWKPTYKYISHFNPEILEENHHWNSSKNTWKLYSGLKREYASDNHNHPLSEKRYFWNNTLKNGAGDWTHILSTTYNYNKRTQTGKTSVKEQHIIHMWNEYGRLHIVNAPIGETLALYTIHGALIQKESINSTSLSILLPKPGLYLLQLGSFSAKIRY